MKHTSRTYFLMSLLCLLLAMGLWVYFLFFVRELGTSSRSLETESASAYAKRDDLVATKQLSESIATSTQVLYGAFASSADIATVVQVIEDEGARHSIAIKVQTIATASSTDPAILTLDMDIHASGSWANLVSFSGSLERLSYALVLTKASFFTDATVKGGWSLAAHITSFLSP